MGATSGSGSDSPGSKLDGRGGNSREGEGE
jgi:hypothetical protein